jgi:ABC-type lipoprotein release transport system permease subunit
MIFIKLAWRNLFRNKRRTLISSLAIGLGLAALILSDGVMLGLVRVMVKLATSSFMGEAQIQNSDFRRTQDVQQVIFDHTAVINGLSQEELVDKFSPRVLSLAMISSPANVSGVSLVGVDPSSERYLSKIDDAVVQGNYFTGYDDREIVMGVKLAEILEAELGDRIVVTVSQAHSGDLSQEMFRISGIYDMKDRTLNSGMAFIRLSRAQKMLGLGDNVHQIAIKFKDPKTSENLQLPFWGKYSTHGNQALSWMQLMPQVKSMIDLSQVSTLIMAVILIGVVAFVILNTLFMSIFERMFEFGVLRALGTRAFGISKLILFEAGSLAVISIALGALLGLASTLVLAAIGINYGGAEFYGLTFNESIRPEFRLMQYIIYPFWVFIFTLAIGIYPAIHASRIEPAKAMRKSF